MKKLRYRKSMNHNYLVAEKPAGDEWQLNMLLENHIPGLLPVSLRMNEGREELYFEISSLQPLSRIYEHREIPLGEAKHLLAEICNTVGNLQEYMLGEEGLMLDAEALFTDPESLTPKLIYLPGCGNSLREQLMGLSEYLMEHMEQSDAASSIWAYQLYKRLRNENFVLGELEEQLKETSATEEVRMSQTYKYEEPEEKYGGSFPEEDEDRDEEVLITLEEKKEEQPRESWWRRLLFGKREKKEKKDRKKKEASIRKKEVRKEEEDEEEDRFDFSGVFSDLEDDKEGGESPDYGKTVFLGEADEPVENVLVDKKRGQRIPMERFPFTIGKLKERVDLAVSDGSVSRIHARIRMQNGRAFLQDCHSTNGTFVNGIQLEAEEEVMLERDDEIRVGRVVFSYC